MMAIKHRSKRLDENHVFAIFLADPRLPAAGKFNDLIFD
jgi:hypothetical protein